MAMMRNPFFSNCSMMSPMAFFRTASGFTMVRVRWSVFISVVGPWSFVIGRDVACNVSVEPYVPVFLDGRDVASYLSTHLLRWPPPGSLQWRPETSPPGYLLL